MLPRFEVKCHFLSLVVVLTCMISSENHSKKRERTKLVSEGNKLAKLRHTEDAKTTSRLFKKIHKKITD